MNRPAPDSAFRWSHESWGAALRCRPLEAIAQHVFTTRQLQLRPFDRQATAWQAAVASVGGTVEDLRRIKQVHGGTVRIVRGGEPLDQGRPPEADAIVSNIAGQILSVQVADCVPLLMADPHTGAAAAVHAGWRGSVARIASTAVRTLSAEYGVMPEDLIVGIGPSIGPCCYDVGPELVTAFEGSGAGNEQIARWFTRTPEGTCRLNLWAVNRDQLIEAGVAPDHIHVARLCTRTHSNIFDSFRAEGPAAGRNAALIRCAPPAV